MSIILTEDQSKAINEFVAFLADPNEHRFVIQGYSGTGKTTLITTILQELKGIIKNLAKKHHHLNGYRVELTATTNKAAENFAAIAKQPVVTIHSFLGLRVFNDFSTGETRLVQSSKHKKQSNAILFIDEASYVDNELLSWIGRKTQNCKIIFIGDPAQLAPVKSTNTPVFDAPYPRVHLTKVVRQASDNPIIELCTRLRESVVSQQLCEITECGDIIKRLDRAAFNQAVLDEFTGPDYRTNKSKILAWTNRKVIEYNKFIQNHVKGNPDFVVGDYAVCNKHLSYDKIKIKTDQHVCITALGDVEEAYGVMGKVVTLDHKVEAFMPLSYEKTKDLVKWARENDRIDIVEEVESCWVDLRHAYACTINKSQGSTYDKVYIDLDDVLRCDDIVQVARMLYVGVSRARNQVIVTG